MHGRLALLIAVLAAPQAAAEPIIGRFNVQVSRGLAYDPSTPATETTLDIRFVLTVTFDGTIFEDRIPGTDWLFHQYGRPEFSTPPLRVPPRPRGEVIDVNSGATQSRFEGDPDEWFQSGNIEVSELTTGVIRDAYESALILHGARRSLGAPPPLTPATLLELVGTPGSTPNFIYLARLQPDWPDGAQYYNYYEGYATLSSEAPIPEPASVVLLGIGLTGIVVRQLKGWRTPESRPTRRFYRCRQSTSA